MPRPQKVDQKMGHSVDFLSQLSVAPLNFNRATGAQIFDVLMLAILRLELPPGSLISEAEVAARFGASRTPVREAFMQLREIDLVVTRASRGNFVTRLKEDRILEARFIREAMELANIRLLCAEGLGEGFEQELRDNLNQQAACVDDDELLAFHSLDDAFHLTLARATGFPRAAELLLREKVPLDRLRAFSLVDLPHKKGLYKEHLAIFEAILDRNEELAVEAMVAHVNSIRKVLASVMQEHAEFFE